MTDIEYIYNKGLQLNLPIRLECASTDLGFYPDLDSYVITGKSEIGEMLLYQDNGTNEFVFTLVYSRRGKHFQKQKAAHWHPDECQMAIDDMVAFMNNDRKYFRRVRLINL